MLVDSSTYDKAKHYPPRHGYQLRGTVPTSIVVHSTSSSVKNTAFSAEATYLFTSADVSAHYLISKSGQIVQFLEPSPWQAWHAGAAQDAFQNAHSVGIELHHSVGDPPYPQAQRDALTWLVRDLISVFRISLARIDTHGQIALPGPYDRKHDPHDWPYDAFLAWRAALVSAPPPTYYHTLAPMWISETPSPRGPIALGGKAVLEAGEVVAVDEVKSDYAHLASGVGFVPIGGLGKP